MKLITQLTTVGITVNLYSCKLSKNTRSLPRLGRGPRCVCLARLDTRLRHCCCLLRGDNFPSRSVFPLRTGWARLSFSLKRRRSLLKFVSQCQDPIFSFFREEKARRLAARLLCLAHSVFALSGGELYAGMRYASRGYFHFF